MLVAHLRFADRSAAGVQRRSTSRQARQRKQASRTPFLPTRVRAEITCANSWRVPCFRGSSQGTVNLQLPPRKHAVLAKTACFRGGSGRYCDPTEDPRKHGTQTNRLSHFCAVRYAASRTLRLAAARRSHCSSTNKPQIW